MRLFSLSLAAALVLVAPPSLPAQSEVPSLRWRTIHTEHFRIHYEPGLEAWATQLASRIEGVRSAVGSRVGYTPPRVIDVLVEDPVNQPNGSAWPSLTYPGMRFWATPPSPTSLIGNSRGWGDILSVHEYAHLAQLLRPSRKPFAFPLAVMSVVPLAPITMAPAWVAEGYATLIEGEITGSGRPNSALRPAIIRTLALEGYLPAYGELDATSRFNGGAMRYLIGSAYLEWLQSMRGDSALPQLWRRATARQKRDFPEAFTGIFGDSPDLLYGRFAAEVTSRAFAVRAELEAQGLARGELVQRWNFSSGAPDVSPNGERLAIRRATPKDAGAVLVYTFKADTTAARRDSTASAKRLKRDPQDVLPFRPYPRELRRIARLGPVAGIAYDAPRFMPDGEHLLVTRPVPLADGRARSDLFDWNSVNGKIRRITKGAGIVLADPTPDGKHAAALTCGSGTCSLVMVDVETGQLRMLAAGGVDRGFAGVRVSPDGRFVASAQQAGAHWVPVVVDVASGELHKVGPNDGVTRHSPTWENDSTLIVASEASGAVELHRLPLAGGTITVAARTLGAAMSPEVGPDGRIWWMDLHARGWDLRVNAANTALPLAAPVSEVNFPASRRIATDKAVEFPPAPVAPARDYGRGPFGAAVLVLTQSAPDGDTWSMGASLGDPLARGSAVMIAGTGGRGGWSGALGRFTWRGFRPDITLEGFTGEYRPSKQQRNRGDGWESADESFAGALALMTYTRSHPHGSTRLRLGGSGASTRNPTLGGTSVTRSQGVALVNGEYVATPRAQRSYTLAYALTAASGSTDAQAWTRYTADLAMGFSSAQGGLNIRARGGEASHDAPLSEQFVVGGTLSPYVNGLATTQRVEHFGLPFGAQGGRRFGIFTVESSGPLRLYHDWIAGGDDELGASLRVLGVEASLAVPQVAILRVPSALLRAGASHVLNGPLRNATFGYVGLTLTP